MVRFKDSALSVISVVTQFFPFSVFDVNNKDSFRSLPRWIDEMEQFCMGGATNVIKYVVGNKTDQERREVTISKRTAHLPLSKLHNS